MLLEIRTRSCSHGYIVQYCTVYIEWPSEANAPWLWERLKANLGSLGFLTNNPF